MTTSDRTRRIDELLQMLEKSNRKEGARSNTSRNIRRELRYLGHRGGLRTAERKG